VDIYDELMRQAVQREIILALFGGGRFRMSPHGLVDMARPYLHNQDGSRSTERTVTTNNPTINDGMWTNVPSIWDGRQIESEDEIVRRAKESGIPYRPFRSMDEAVRSAISRSDNLHRYRR